MLITCPICRAECTIDNLSVDTVTCPTCGQQLSTRTGSPASQVVIGDTPAAKDETREWHEADVVTAVDIDVLPVRLGRYFIELLIAQGGFAKVYLATDEALGRRLALKIPRIEKFRTPAKLRQFLAEARIAAKLRHPGIVTIFDVGQFANGANYIAMEYVAGQSLSELMHAARIPVPRAVELMIKIAEAVHYAHSQGLVHRDLKPGNILIDERGEPRVVDFGLAVHEASQVQFQGEVAGTPAFMSPEQFRGEVHRLDGRTDIWSLGCVFYQLLTGRRPFNGNVSQLYDEVLNKAPKPPRQIDDRIPRELESVCFKCLSKSVEDRYTTSKDLAEALADWQRENSSVQAAVASPPIGIRGVDRLLAKRLSVRTALALLLVTTVAFAAVQLVPSRKGQGVKPVLTTLPVAPRQGSGDTPELRTFFRVDDRTPRGKWLPLLDRKPNELFWRDNSSIARWVYDESREEVLIDSLDAGFLGAGLTESRNFALKTGIAKKSWTGRAGLFWGYQARTFEGREVFQCQTVALSCVPEKEGTKYLIDRTMFQFIPQPGESGPNISSSGICAAEEIVKPGITENELELEVAAGLVKEVRWCGKPLLSLSDNANTLPFVTPVTTGWFGVWNNDGTSVFLNTQFKAIGGPIHQEEDPK